MDKIIAAAARSLRASKNYEMAKELEKQWEDYRFQHKALQQHYRNVKKDAQKLISTLSEACHAVAAVQDQ